MPISEDMNKTCIKCRETKPLSGFHTSPRCADGHYNVCRACINKRRVETYSQEKQDKKARTYDSKKSDPNFKEKLKTRHYRYIENNPHQHALRGIINNYLKPRKTERRNGCKYESIVGYKPEDLKAHIERKFLPGMTWDNRGTWHIDHITPISKFEIGTPFSVINALNNLRPLWKEDNLKRRKDGF